MHLVEGTLCERPWGRETGQRGTLRVELPLSPWRVGADGPAQTQPLVVSMLMDLDLADAGLGHAEPGDRVRARGVFDVPSGFSAHAIERLLLQA